MSSVVSEHLPAHLVDPRGTFGSEGIPGQARSERQSLAAKTPGTTTLNVAAVALANKNARIVWALLARDRDYESGYAPTKASAAA
ncbi:hypothetical protein PSUB009319_42720 [Ralstonia sp. SET104]|nr:hypothetical protein PSUB009319_42720 [Ralstonia sp. SET104]